MHKRVTATSVNPICQQQRQRLAACHQQVVYNGQLQSHVEVAYKLENKRRRDKKQRHDNNIVEVGYYRIVNIQYGIDVANLYQKNQ
jgi:hypothetical protein